MKLSSVGREETSLEIRIDWKISKKLQGAEMADGLFPSFIISNG